MKQTDELDLDLAAGWRARLKGPLAHCLLAAALLLATAVAYLPVRHAAFVWDDDDYLTENKAVQQLGGLKRIWLEPRTSPQYYPAVFTTFWAEYRLWGLHPLGYHLVNVALHGLNAVLLWRVLRRVRLPGAYLAAAIFAVHPVMVESVAWVTERKNVLSEMFYLLALLAWLRFRPLDGPAGRRGGWPYYALSLGLFAAALFSKTVTASLPAAILLLIWWKRGRLGWRDAAPLAPFFVLAGLLGSVTAMMEQQHVGAAGAEWSLSAIERCLVAGRAVWFYAGKLAWPAELIFVYPRWTPSTDVWWHWIFPAAVLAAVLAAWLLRARVGRGPLVAVLFFVGTLTPALGFFDVYPHRFSFVADHFQYHASVGLIALTAAAFVTGVITLARWSGRGGVVAVAVLVTALPTTLGALTFRQTCVYRDGETLWRDTLAKNPRAWLAMNNLATLLGDRGELEKALSLLEQSLAAKPDYADAHANRGEIYRRMGRPALAIRDCTEAIRLNPNLAMAHLNRGLAHSARGEVELAIRDYTRAVELSPSLTRGYANRGVAYGRKGDRASAMRDFEKAIELDAEDPAAYNNRANLLLDLGEVDRAIRDYTEAIRIAPRFAPSYHNRAIAWLAKGDYDKAWADVHACRRLGGRIVPEVLDGLCKASGRNE